MEAVDAEHAATPTLAISSAAVRLVRRHTGREAPTVETYMQHDLVTVLIRESLTAEFQKFMQADLVHTVETALQRPVLAAMSARHAKPDLAVETFLLAPRPGDVD
jgi:hypothetical protein